MIFWILIPALIYASYYDIKYRQLPNILTCSLMVVGVGFNGLEGCYGLLLGGLIFWVILVTAQLALGMEIIGGGDIKLMAGVGACLGLSDVFLVACVAVSLAVIILVFRKGKCIPFAPLVLIATFLAI